MCKREVVGQRVNSKEGPITHFPFDVFINSSALSISFVSPSNRWTLPSLRPFRSSPSTLQVCRMRRGVSRSWPSTPTRCEASTCSLQMSTSRNWPPRRRTTAVQSWRGWSGLLSPLQWTDTLRSLGSFQICNDCTIRNAANKKDQFLLRLLLKCCNNCSLRKVSSSDQTEPIVIQVHYLEGIVTTQVSENKLVSLSLIHLWCVDNKCNTAASKRS